MLPDFRHLGVCNTTHQSDIKRWHESHSVACVYNNGHLQDASQPHVTVHASLVLVMPSAP